MSFKKIIFSEPVEALSGKMNKNSKLVFRQIATCGQRAAGMGKRNLTLNPYSPDEDAAKVLFKTRAANVAARIKSDSATYAADIKAFMAQKAQPGGIQRFKAWLWADEMSKE